MLDSWKSFNISISLLPVYNIIITNLFRQFLMYLMCSAQRKLFALDLFLDSDSFIIAYPIFLVNVQTNYCNNNLLILDVKQLKKIIKIYYFYTFKAL